jgi:acetyl esterase/lipase
MTLTLPEVSKMMMRLLNILFFIFISLILINCRSDSDPAYDNFLARIEADEPYIGFLATEKKCISDINDDYLKARQTFFLGVDTCEEDPEEFIESFIEYCKSNKLLNDGCEEDWEKVLTILSYELYGNKPIFAYAPKNVIAHRNLVFAEYPNKKLMLDLFLPENQGDDPIPAVVCIHGGGWRVNRRVWFEPFAQYLADNGFAAVTIDYRMLPAVTIKECVYDSKAAVRWVRANADKYGIDPQRIGAIGASAGAHLVALLGTTADIPEIEGTGGNQDQSSAVQAVVGIATPSFNLSKDARFARWLGMSSEEVKLMSPYENIDKSSAPLYLIHGTVDETVPPDNSQELHDIYKEVGVHVELTWIPNEGHGFYEGNDRGIALATEFFTKILMGENGLE